MKRHGFTNFWLIIQSIGALWAIFSPSENKAINVICGIIFLFVIILILNGKNIGWRLLVVLLVIGIIFNIVAINTAAVVGGIVGLILTGISIHLEKKGKENESKTPPVFRKKRNINELDYKNILTYHSLNEYINLFEENRLDSINIIMTLSENDYEKIGVKRLGDIKKLINIFSKKELIKNMGNYINNLEPDNNENNIIDDSNPVKNFIYGNKPLSVNERMLINIKSTAFQSMEEKDECTESLKEQFHNADNEEGKERIAKIPPFYRNYL